MNRIYLISCLFLYCAILTAQTDSIPPFITCPPADTVTLSPGGDCTFQYFYAVTSGDNEPGDTLVQLSGLESGADFPMGNTVNVFQAVDAAGNTATCSFTLTVQQYFGPLTCKSFVAASVGPDCTWQPDAAMLLDGNFGCPGGYLVEVDKEAPYGNGPWELATFGPDDIGETYIFRVTDTITGNACQGNIKANDMLPPVLTCQDITISCAVDNVSPYFLQDSLAIPFAVSLATDACSQVFLLHLDAAESSDCASGFVGIINREWTAQDDHGNSSTCIQRIYLTRPVLADLRFPPNVTVNCDADISAEKIGEPYLEFAGRKFTNTCSLGAAYTDSTIQSGACASQVLRTWFALDWCTGDALDTVQVIDIQDAAGPEFQSCPDSTLTFGDTTSTNDPMLWNAPHWANPPGAMENRCEGPAHLHVTVSDACSGIPNLRYLLFLDLDGNGTQETVVDSDNPPAAGTVNFGNAANPDYSGGEPRSFDERTVDSTLKYRFAIQYLASGDTITGSVAWNSDSTPAEFATPQFPHGMHKIRWITVDSCENETICEYSFTVKDTIPPVVVCTDTSLIVNIMPPGFTVISLPDLFPSALDDCTPSDSIRFGIRITGAGTGFPIDTLGNPLFSVAFDCTQLGDQIIELWAQDLDGNADYCEINVTVDDSSAYCFGDPDLLFVAGNIKTENTIPVASVNVKIEVYPASQGSVFQTQTNLDGIFGFAVPFPTAGDYILTPYKNTNHLDGVSTFDLVLISKHILGLEALDSPYKMIAADANRSNFITTFDVVEIRKLILGIYSDLPNNTSWRFVDADYVFPDPVNPFQTPFPESIARVDVQSQQLEDDFIGIKTGDVNGTAIGDSLLVPDDRSEGVLFFDIHNREVRAGEAFTVPFTASEKVLGYQFTLDFNGLEVLEVLPGQGMTTGNFAVFPGTVTASVENGAETFAIKFRAACAGRLSDMLSVSSRITRAEGYRAIDNNYNNSSIALSEVALRFDDGIIGQPGFELYQNQPNPFMDNTHIGFNLPENTEATLTVFDETGRALLTRSGLFLRGYNAFLIEKTALGTPGLFYYKLETPTHSAVRKMVLLR